LLEVPQSVLKSSSRLWGSVAPNQNYLSYASEKDIAKVVITLLEDVRNAMGLELKFSEELGIKSIRPDICVLTYGKRLVGVVEIKKQGPDILLQPTVLGELLDQLLLVEGFYSSGPVIGILTTFSEWLFAWFPADNDNFIQNNFDVQEKKQFFSPAKSNVTSVKLSSPPLDTPSNKNKNIHEIEILRENESAIEENLPSNERRLHTTNVINAHHSFLSVLQHIYTAFIRMSYVQLNYREGIYKCVFKLYKDEFKITWHPLDFKAVLDLSKLLVSNFPRKNTKTLVAMEDLGRGSAGRAWLMCSLTKPKPSICVLKFYNKESVSAYSSLKNEEAIWNLIYPEFSEMIKVEFWSGAHALMMPHFSFIPEEERTEFLPQVYKLLVEKFQLNNVVHKDVRWRNMGRYKKKGEVKLVLFDFSHAEILQTQPDKKWIDEAMNGLVSVV
jgi:hypothetical protein